MSDLFPPMMKKLLAIYILLVFVLFGMVGYLVHSITEVGLKNVVETVWEGKENESSD